jgi:SAM-dependent methyltransferase
VEHYGDLCSEVYDLTKPVNRDYPDVGYYMRRLSQLGDAGCRSLEVATGTGRLLIPLLEAGFEVDGVDNSVQMLDLCRRSCEARGLTPDLYEADIRSMSLPRVYEAIIVSFGSFMLLEDRTDAVGALENFARHLSPGGRLFIDLELPSLEDLRNGERRHVQTVQCPDGSRITVEEAVTCDLLEQVNSSLLHYERVRDGRVVETELQRLPVRWYGRHEFTSLLRETGFTGVELCADYQEGTQPTRESTHLCFSASYTGD